MAEEKKGFHRAWLIFIGVCMMNAGGMGLVLNVMGNYFGPMAVAFGLINPETGAVDVTQVTLLMTVYSYVMLVWLPFVGRLFGKIDARILFGAGAILIAAGCLLMNVWTAVWQIYISGACFGLAGPICFLVGPSFLINQWFAPSQAGKFLGIASAFTGAGTVIWSPLFASMVAANGYKFGFTVEAVIVLILILLPALFFFRNSPEECGLKPWGIEKEPQTSGEVKKAGVDGKFALTTVAFWCILIAAGLISLGGGYKSMMPTAVQSVGGPELAMLGATMISAGALGNAIGKILLGVVADKIGIRNAMVVFAVAWAIGFALIIAFLGDNMIPMVAAGFFIGTADAMMSVGLPLITRHCFGDRRYGEIYSYMNMPIALLGGIGATFVSVVGNAMGFQAAYGVGILFSALIAVAIIIAAGNAGKIRNSEKWIEE